MEIRFNVTGAARKEFVKAVSEITGEAAVYQFAPSFAFTVGAYTIDKTGTLVCGNVDADALGALLSGLRSRGFAFEPDFGDLESLPGAASVAADSPFQGVEEDSGLLAIEVPLTGFTETALANLEKLITGKAALICKALGADSLPIERLEDRLRFPWFGADASPETVAAYSKFVAALCETAKTQKRVILKEKPLDEGASEKFAMRCFLLKLGFIGDEYKEARKILLANMSGNGSHKTGDGKRFAEGGAVYA